MNCIHGLPSYCCAVCNGVKLEHPEFRRRKPEDERINYGASGYRMQEAAASQSRFGRLDLARSDWRRESLLRDIVELSEKIRKFKMN